MSDEAVIETQGLSKRYGRTWALREVDLRVERGQVYGLLRLPGEKKPVPPIFARPRQDNAPSIANIIVSYAFH